MSDTSRTPGNADDWEDDLDRAFESTAADFPNADDAEVDPAPRPDRATRQQAEAPAPRADEDTDDGYDDDADDGSSPAGSDADDPDGDAAEDTDDADAEDEDAVFDRLSQTPRGRQMLQQMQEATNAANRVADETRQREEQQRVNAQLTQWQARIDAMDPEDRAQFMAKLAIEHAAKVTQQLNQRTEQEQTEREFQTQHRTALDFIAAGGRVVDGMKVQAKARPLHPDDRAVLTNIRSSPEEMEAMADHLARVRSQARNSVRSATAKRRRDDGEGATGGGAGRGGSSAPVDAPENIDDFFSQHDATYGRRPARAS